MTMGPCSDMQGHAVEPDHPEMQNQRLQHRRTGGMEIPELIEVVKTIKVPAAEPMVKALLERLQHLVDIGLEYLSLNRETDTLSGGESQRVKIVKHLGSSLMRCDVYL